MSQQYIRVANVEVIYFSETGYINANKMNRNSYIVDISSQSVN